MFMAAAPYFDRRFRSDTWIRTHFQAAELSVSCVTNLCSMIILTKLQKDASYPKRISSALIINISCFILLALSTVTDTSAGVYFVFLMLMVFCASLATGLIQNGLFAYVTGFGKSEYTQAIMTGQAIAGVLPCVAQIFSVLAVPAKSANTGKGPQESWKSAFWYFIAASAVSGLALFSFLWLVAERNSQANLASIAHQISQGVDEAEEEEPIERKTVGLWTLFKKLRWLAAAVFLCFCVTMVFPVFTQKIYSVRDPENSPRFFHAASFIPLALLVWNLGDLAGRLTTLYPKVVITQYPLLLFIIAIARVGFIPLYLLCNVDNRGALIPSDAFYLFIVQLLFGITNGYLGSSCMMGASQWVEPEEREAAGGFMGLMLVSGLTVGSLLSFLAGDA
jgi:solute carrier family 29 (equilibrative nucleoside transporter), member 1/2/3